MSSFGPSKLYYFKFTIDRDLKPIAQHAVQCTIALSRIAMFVGAMAALMLMIKGREQNGI